MKNAREIQEEIAAAQVRQKTAANDALLPGKSKVERKEARMAFLHLSGQIQGLKTALGNEPE